MTVKLQDLNMDNEVATVTDWQQEFTDVSNKLKVTIHDNFKAYLQAGSDADNIDFQNFEEALKKIPSTPNTATKSEYSEKSIAVAEYWQLIVSFTKEVSERIELLNKNYKEFANEAVPKINQLQKKVAAAKAKSNSIKRQIKIAQEEVFGKEPIEGVVEDLTGLLKFDKAIKDVDTIIIKQQGLQAKIGALKELMKPENDLSKLTKLLDEIKNLEISFSLMVGKYNKNFAELLAKKDVQSKDVRDFVGFVSAEYLLEILHKQEKLLQTIDNLPSTIAAVVPEQWTGLVKAGAEALGLNSERKTALKATFEKELTCHIETANQTALKFDSHFNENLQILENKAQEILNKITDLTQDEHIVLSDVNNNSTDISESGVLQDELNVSVKLSEMIKKLESQKNLWDNEYKKIVDEKKQPQKADTTNNNTHAKTLQLLAANPQPKTNIVPKQTVANDTKEISENVLSPEQKALAEFKEQLANDIVSAAKVSNEYLKAAKIALAKSFQILVEDSVELIEDQVEIYRVKKDLLQIMVDQNEENTLLNIGTFSGRRNFGKEEQEFTLNQFKLFLKEQASKSIAETKVINEEQINKTEVISTAQDVIEDFVEIIEEQVEDSQSKNDLLQAVVEQQEEQVNTAESSAEVVSTAIPKVYINSEALTRMKNEMQSYINSRDGDSSAWVSFCNRFRNPYLTKAKEMLARCFLYELEKYGDKWTAEHTAEQIKQYEDANYCLEELALRNQNEKLKQISRYSLITGNNYANFIEDLNKHVIGAVKAFFDNNEEIELTIGGCGRRNKLNDHLVACAVAVEEAKVPQHKEYTLPLGLRLF